MAELNERQKRFVDEYMIDPNATQAAIRAGYSAKTAAETASRLLTNVKVSEEIERRRKALAVRSGVTPERVLQELAAIAFSDAGDFAQVTRVKLPGTDIWVKGVSLVETRKLNTAQRAAIAGIKQGRNGVEVKLLDKLGALRMIGDHLGMFKAEPPEKKKDTSLMEALLKAVSDD